jgi:hypothetical protein
MGHHSVSFTLDTYGHVIPKQRSEVANIMAEAIAG